MKLLNRNCEKKTSREKTTKVEKKEEKGRKKTREISNEQKGQTYPKNPQEKNTKGKEQRFNTNIKPQEMNNKNPCPGTILITIFSLIFTMVCGRLFNIGRNMGKGFFPSRASQRRFGRFQTWCGGTR